MSQVSSKTLPATSWPPSLFSPLKNCEEYAVKSFSLQDPLILFFIRTLALKQIRFSNLGQEFILKVCYWEDNQKRIEIAASESCLQQNCCTYQGDENRKPTRDIKGPDLPAVMLILNIVILSHSVMTWWCDDLIELWGLDFLASAFSKLFQLIWFFLYATY